MTFFQFEKLAFEKEDEIIRVQRWLNVVTGFLLAIGGSLLIASLAAAIEPELIKPLAFRGTLAATPLLWVPITMALNARRVRALRRSRHQDFLNYLLQLPELATNASDWSNPQLQNLDHLMSHTDGPFCDDEKLQLVATVFAFRQLNLGVLAASTGVVLSGACLFAIVCAEANSLSLLKLLLPSVVPALLAYVLFVEIKTQ